MANRQKNVLDDVAEFERLGSTYPKKFRKRGGTRNRMQTLCIWCGHPRQLTKCGTMCQKIRPQVRAAIQRFARENGRTWKARLAQEWERACARITDPEYRQLLQEARNILGSRLAKVEV